MDNAINKKLLKLSADWIIWSAAFFIAFLLRFDLNFSAISSPVLQFGLVLSVAKLIVILLARGYDHSWRNTSFVDVFKLLMIGSFASFGLLLFFNFESYSGTYSTIYSSTRIGSYNFCLDRS